MSDAPHSPSAHQADASEPTPHAPAWENLPPPGPDNIITKGGWPGSDQVADWKSSADSQQDQ